MKPGGKVGNKNHPQTQTERKEKKRKESKKKKKRDTQNPQRTSSIRRNEKPIKKKCEGKKERKVFIFKSIGNQ